MIQEEDGNDQRIRRGFSMNLAWLGQPTPVHARLSARPNTDADAVRRMAAFVAFCALATGLFAQTAYALDCAKPATRAEATICSSSTLQRLDRKTDRLYQEALKGLSSPISVSIFQAGQREWLRKRDAETSAGGLERAYQQRIASLHCVLLRKMRAHTPRPRFKTPPVYPDVWGYLPDPKGPELIGGALLPDGDVGLSFLGEKSGRVEFKRFIFKKPLTSEEKCRIRSNVWPFHAHATLSDGRAITAMLGDWTPRTHCYMGPASNAVDIYPQGPHSASQEIEKTFLYVLAKPQHVVNGRFCEAHPAESFTLRVAPLPLVQFLPLPDGTFLVMSSNGRDSGFPDFVMRFDSHFQTKSQILKGKLFIVDTAKLTHFLDHAHYRNYESMQRGLKRWLTGNKQLRNR